MLRAFVVRNRLGSCHVGSFPAAVQAKVLCLVARARSACGEAASSAAQVTTSPDGKSQSANPADQFRLMESIYIYIYVFNCIYIRLY